MTCLTISTSSTLWGHMRKKRSAQKRKAPKMTKACTFPQQGLCHVPHKLRTARWLLKKGPSHDTTRALVLSRVVFRLQMQQTRSNAAATRALCMQQTTLLLRTEATMKMTSSGTMLIHPLRRCADMPSSAHAAARRPRSRTQQRRIRALSTEVLSSNARRC